MCTMHIDAARASGLEDHDWQALLAAIENQDCTPFLGAGACAGRLPSSAELAFDLATEVNYPLPDCDDLARVSQFAALRLGAVNAKRKVLKLLERARNSKDRPSAYEPHRILAQLPLKLYITTNYDDLMFRALQQERGKADRAHCRWYDSAARTHTEDRPSWQALSVERPLVFHLHGCGSEPRSMVLTEDDYLDFLVRIGGDLSVVPPVIQAALAGSSLLFIGYGLRDWNFRVLHRVLLSQVLKSQESPSFIVQLTPFEYKTGCVATVYLKNGDKVTGTVIAGEAGRLKVKGRTVGTVKIRLEEVRYVQVIEPGDQHLGAMEEVMKYLRDYYQQMKIRVFWGTAQEFVRELSRRWSTRRTSRLSDARPAEGVVPR